MIKFFKSWVVGKQSVLLSLQNIANFYIVLGACLYASNTGAELLCILKINFSHQAT